MAKIYTVKRALAAFSLAAAFAPGLPGGAAHAGLLADSDLRPLYAMGRDLSEGKELATTVCAKCHGVDGLAAAKAESPVLAGQRPSYIYRELKAYQTKARSNPDMYEKVKFLSDAALVQVAAYYASLDPAPLPTAPAPKIVDPLEAGKAGAASCVKCHGDNFISKKAGVPNLVGFGTKYFIEVTKAYLSGDRKVDEKNEDMTKALKALSDKDLVNVAVYIGVHKDNLTPAQTPAEGNAANVTKDKLAVCAKCHGEDGIGTSPASPSIAGQDWTYIVNSLRSYKTAERDDDVMTPRAKKLSDDEMKDLAAYYASKTPKGSDVQRPLKPEEWAEKCDHCHGAKGNSARPEVPALASQKMDYLVNVLNAYRAGDRKSSEMSAMSSVLTDDDIAGIAAYYAYQKASSVVFVPVPK